jgi:hypothetical protein
MLSPNTKWFLLLFSMEASLVSNTLLEFYLLMVFYEGGLTL